MIGRFLGRFPRTIATLILAVLAVSIWQATVYVDTVIRPREAAARQALIEREIDRADKLFARAKYETALSEYDYVLTGYGAELSAPVEGRLRDRVGTCLVELAKDGDAKGDFEAGIASYRQSLALRPAAVDTVGHAATWYRIGGAYLAMSRETGEAEPVGNALDAYEAGLQVLSADADAAQYATGLRSVGNAHRWLFELDRERNPMDNALRHYQEALRIANAIEQPVAHGETLMDVGRAYVLLSEKGYRLRQLKQAIETYEDALDVFTVEDYPRRHAAAHKEMGDTYTAMSKLGPKGRTDRAAHQQRVIHYENKAKQSYRIAKSFGLEPGFEVAGAEEPAPPVEEEKKE